MSRLSFKVLDATKRLGCEEMEGYGPLKAHPFFESITWENLHQQTPPKLTAYLPAMSEDDEDCYGNVSWHTRGMAPAKRSCLPCCVNMVTWGLNFCYHWLKCMSEYCGLGDC